MGVGGGILWGVGWVGVFNLMGIYFLERGEGV